jgi:hypothetical protein
VTANVEVGVRHGRYETLFSPEDVPELRCSGAALREAGRFGPSPFGERWRHGGAYLV